MAAGVHAQQEVEVVEKEVRCLELRKEGKTYAEIARAVGYNDKAAAHKAVKRALRKAIQEPAEELIIIEVQRLDKLLEAVWEKATRKTGKGQMFAVDRALSIMKRRADLLGLDAPTKHETITKDAVTSEIEKLEKKLGPEKVAELRSKVNEVRGQASS